MAAAEHSAPSALAHFDPADLLDALSTGIVMLDAQLCPIYANVAAQDLLAFSLKKARGRPFTDLLHEPESLRGILRRALDERREHRRPRAVGASGGGAARGAHPRRDHHPARRGHRQHLLLELADTTQRQRISRDNDLLARLDGSRLMVRQLAHEIKNPLGGLRGAAQLLERELPGAALKEYTRVIIGEADRLTALVDSMAGPSRAPSKAALNIHEICEHVYHLLRAEAPATLADRARLRPEPADAMLDRHQLIQALLNVARNALQAQGDRGRIVLRTRARSSVSIGLGAHRLVASVQVEDNGPGVPPHLRSSIFYPLVTGRANGTGLGLAVAQELVTRNGGIIEFESEAGAHRVHAAVAPGRRDMNGTASLAGRRRRFHPLGARTRAAQRRHGAARLRSGGAGARCAAARHPRRADHRHPHARRLGTGAAAPHPRCPPGAAGDRHDGALGPGQRGVGLRGRGVRVPAEALRHRPGGGAGAARGDRRARRRQRRGAARRASRSCWGARPPCSRCFAPSGAWRAPR